MSLKLKITLANIDCSQASDDDSDRIVLALTNGEIVIEQCGHPSTTRYCVDTRFTRPEIANVLYRLSGVRQDEYDLHAGIATSSEIGQSPLIVPSVDGLTLMEFSFPEQIVNFIPTTTKALARKRGLILTTSVA